MTTTSVDTTAAVMPSCHWKLWVVVALLLVTGLGLRLSHITDPPLDYHAQRQYWNANRARLLYYQSLEYVEGWRLSLAQQAAERSTEPPILERLAVIGYHISGGENLAIPRALSAIFFTLGGLYLFLLARRVLTVPGALVALAYYLFVPFGVVATRTFQPDPLMTALITVSLYLLYRYYEQRTLTRLLLALPWCGLAMYVKPMAAPFLVAAFLALVTAPLPDSPPAMRFQWWRKLSHPHVLLFGGVMLLALFVYLQALFSPTASAMSVSGQASKTFQPHLFAMPQYWQGLLHMLGTSTVQYWALLFGVLGALLTPVSGLRRLLVGGGLAFLVYLVVFNYHVQTHSYYSLPLLPFVALGLGALVSVLTPLLFPAQAFAQRVAVWAVFGLVVTVTTLLTGASLVRPEFQILVRDFEDIGKRVAHTKDAVFLTPAHGDPLVYHGWIAGHNWPSVSDQAVSHLRRETVPTPEQRLEQYRQLGATCFIITDFAEFSRQDELYRLLTEHYPAVEAKDRYLIFDLTRRTEEHEAPAPATHP